MVDLAAQYAQLKPEIDQALGQVLASAQFIKGPEVAAFEQELAAWCRVGHVITCANGTDALQIAFMALGLRPGDEVIVPAFCYVAPAEAAALLGLKPVWADVLPDTFALDPAQVERAITPRTRAIVPVHLFGQGAPMEPLLQLAQQHQLWVVEDNAQAIGATLRLGNGHQAAAGTLGHLGITSFFPSKNLGCYGDGGAVFTNHSDLAQKVRLIANHGQAKQYEHTLVGVNSRLDALQAAVLRVKLRHLNYFIEQRQQAAAYYDTHLGPCAQLQVPARAPYSTHVFHQYTLLLRHAPRNELKDFLANRQVPSMVYYPHPLHLQPAYRQVQGQAQNFPVAERLCQQALSLPMHPNLDPEQRTYVVQQILEFLDAY